MIYDKYIPAIGNGAAQLMLLGESPSYDEVESGRPFTGPSGRELDRLLKEAGIKREDIWISNVCKYFVHPSPKGKNIPFQVRAKQDGINLEEQINELRIEIQTINPNCIVALGGTALWALTGNTKIKDYRGSILSSWLGKKVIGTYHPAHLLHQEKSEIQAYWQRQVIIFDLRRALSQSNFPEIYRPYRNLQICRDSAQLENFIDHYKNEEKLSIDIEAHNCIPICIGISFTSTSGLTIPLWNMDEFSTIPDSQLASMWIQLANLFNNPRYKKIGQNFKYDQDKITKLGLPIDTLYSDTMLKSFVINPELPKNLAFNTSIYTEEPFYKNEGMYEGSIQDLMMGCARDACVTLEIDNLMEIELAELELAPFYYNFIMKLHQLYLEIENEGFEVDTKKRDELLRKYVAWDERLRYEMFGLVGDYVNPNSWKQVDLLLYENLKIPRRKGTGEEVLTQLLNGPVSDGKRREVINNILESRRVRKVISNNLSALSDYDGKMRTTYYICLETGRSSTGQQEPPIRPNELIIELDDKGHKHKKKKSLGTPFQVMTKHGDIGPEVRAMYLPPKPDKSALNGYIFLQADSSQAEARVIFLLAEDYDALRDIDLHDYHALTASWFFGGTESDYSKKVLGYESPIRFAGKTLRHAGHLGASARRASIELNTQARKYGIDYKISEAESKSALKIFHKKQPKIKEIFQAEVIKQLEKDRTLTAPPPYGIDAIYGGKRTFFERWGDDLFRQAFSYLPQRIVTENTKGAALRIKSRAPWVRIIVESHDALLMAVPIERKLEAAILIKEEFERPINFASCSLSRGHLVIPCEIEEGYNYFELSKFKFINSEVKT